MTLPPIASYVHLREGAPGMLHGAHDMEILSRSSRPSHARPPHAIYSGLRSASGRNNCPQQIYRQMVQQSREPFLFPLPRRLAHAANPETLVPAPCRLVRVLRRSPWSAPFLRSLRRGGCLFVQRFTGTMRSQTLLEYMPACGYSPSGPVCLRRHQGVSRFSCILFLGVPGFRLRRADVGSRCNAPAGVAFR